ncbi:MAG TPA: ATP-binding cassette domain-containing protein [Thermoplasmata archaeon]|nr:ATP-binding cassette domain-containing protein [Thermoplasmata archaeon]
MSALSSAPSAPADPPPAIEVQGLTKRYGSRDRGVLALDQVSLRIPAGTVFGLLGPNGAGKTTLIKVLTGISDITSGDARVAGLDVRRDSLRVRARIGWVAAEVILDDDFSAWENLWLQAKLQDLRDWQERARELLRYFSLDDRRDEKVSRYSTGMRKKLEIALALLHQPSVIFMDEPTIGLDVATRRMLWEIVTGIHTEFGVTVLLTTHYIEEADALCERVAIIDHGRIIAEGSPNELKARVQADLVVLETANGLDPKMLSALPGVQEVRPLGNEWTIRVASAEAFLPKLLHAVPPEEVRRISVEKPSLETVFLDLTGRRLGQDEPMRDVRKFYMQMRRARA